MAAVRSNVTALELADEELLLDETFATEIKQRPGSWKERSPSGRQLFLKSARAFLLPAGSHYLSK
eukprot:4558872-Amphidinium_carterae.1